MIDQNVVDRELGLEVMRRGLLTREALMPFVQKRRSDPSSSFAGLLVQGGVLTKELGVELERVARARAEASAPPPPRTAPLPPMPPPPPPLAAPLVPKVPPVPPRPPVLVPTAPPAPPRPPAKGPAASMDELEFESPQARKDPGTTPATARKDPGTTSGTARKDAGSTSAVIRSKGAPRVAVSVPSNTILDLDLEVPEPAVNPSTSDRLKAVSPEPPPTAAAFQAAGTRVDAAPDPARTMLEDQLDLSEGASGAKPPETAPAPVSPPPPPPLPAGDETKKPEPVEQPRSKNAQVGKVMGDYEILATLGEGAMGTVFRARRRTDGLVVALKVMRGGLVANAKVRDRFLREAKAAKLIDHVNVVRFFDAGMIGNDQFLAMEFVEGRSLQSILGELKGKTLPLARAYELFRQIAGGLSAAHAAGVIHRDLKPDNILLTKDGEVAKITDFGLARREEESMLLTRPGQIMGSPYYMAPEQGQGRPVDARADIYSLGAILFCLVTGRVPFPLPSATEVIQAHCEAERPDPRDLNPEIPEGLAALVLRMLAVKPEERPQTVKKALDDFDEAVESEPDPSLFNETGVAPPPKRDDEDEDGHEVFSTAQIVDALPAGTRVGKLTVEGVLGAGGMGAVYRARHDEGRLSALKVLPKKLAADPKRVKGFLREAELGSKVKHPNVVETRDFGEDPDLGVAYIELELVEGTSLENLIKTGVLQQESLLINVTRGIAQALHALHSAGIIHRDVKPANVLLAGEFLASPDANVKLIDLGLAIARTATPKSGKLSRPALEAAVKGAMPPASPSPEGTEFAGTPLYMAPEQCHTGGEVDERSDIYSLGATIYHAATGHPPFEGSSVAAIAYQHQRANPKPPRERNEGLSPGFCTIIELLLKKDKEARYQTAAALVADLSKMTAEGKLAPPAVHAKYRTNRIYSGEMKLRVETHAAEPPPPRSTLIVATVVAAVCLLVILVQVVRYVLASSPTPVVQPTPGPDTGKGPNTAQGTASTTTDPKSPDALEAARLLAIKEAQKHREDTLAKIDEKMHPRDSKDRPNFLEARTLADGLLRDDATSAPLLTKVRDDLAIVADTFDDDLAAARTCAGKGDWKGFDAKLDEAKLFVSRPEDEGKLAALVKDFAEAHPRR